MAEHKSLEHGSTVIVATNSYELAYIMAWCVKMRKSITPFVSGYDVFPFCISVSGQIVGWTDRMDRALYYKPFMEFVDDIGGN